MKPRLGRKVYCIYGQTILVETVGFLGKDSFIVENFGEDTYANSWEWSYDTYDKNWFTNLAKAKKELLARFEDEGYNLKIVRFSGRGGEWYELWLDEEY